MAGSQSIEVISLELFKALTDRRPVAPLQDRAGRLTIDDAYGISLSLLAKRERAGEVVIGKKIGLTSKPVRDMLGVHQPDFGFLTDRMQVANNTVFEIGSYLIQPRAEGEIAFILNKDLRGPGVTEADVLDATEAVCCCFEIVDSRIENWRIGIIDTVADNASSGIFVLGDSRVDPRHLDLPGLRGRVFKNGIQISEGTGAAVMGSPLTAVAWLANTLGGYGVALQAGETILSGSLVPLEPVVAGDRFEMRIDGLGGVGVSFT